VCVPVPPMRSVFYRARGSHRRSKVKAVASVDIVLGLANQRSSLALIIASYPYGDTFGKDPRIMLLAFTPHAIDAENSGVPSRSFRRFFSFAGKVLPVGFLSRFVSTSYLRSIGLGCLFLS
jgi:hypothetical protein